VIDNLTSDTYNAKDNTDVFLYNLNLLHGRCSWRHQWQRGRATHPNNYSKNVFASQQAFTRVNATSLSNSFKANAFS
jgi:hypothetical protein